MNQNAGLRKKEIVKEIFSPVIISFKEFKFKLTIKMNVGVSIKLIAQT